MATSYSVFSSKGPQGNGSWPYAAEDWIYSPQHLYCAVIEANGNLNVYQGSSPENPDKHQVWSTESSGKLRPNDHVNVTFFPTDKMMQKGGMGPRRMQLHAQGGGPALYLWQDRSMGTFTWEDALECFLTDEGTFGVRQKGENLWDNGFSDPIAEYTVDDCTYDIDHVKRGTPKDKGAMEQDLENNTDTEQSMTMAKTLTMTVTSGWSNTIGLKIAVSAKAGASIPFLGKGEVTVSTEISNAYTWSKSQTNTTSVNLSIPIRVPGHKKYRGYAFLQEVEFEVPYTMRGQFRFKSGQTVTQTITGTYKGANSYLASYRVDDITDKKGPINVVHEEVPPRNALQIRRAPDAAA